LKGTQRKLSKYMLPSHHQIAGQNNGTSIANRSSGNVATFTRSKQKLIPEEIQRKLNYSYSWYYSVQNLCFLVCCLKNVKMRKCKNIILPMVLYGCET
jgi:hypothetical protein